MTNCGTSPFRELQRRFAAHIRDPKNNPRPEDVSALRMAVYTDLFFRNLEQHLAAGFPVIRRIMSDEQWHELVRDFMVHHRCRTPLFPEIGQEFADFLNDTTDDSPFPPFLGELARYGHLEVTVGFSEDDPEPAAACVDSDLLDSRPVFSASAHAVQYRFPVHRIGPDFQPDAAPEIPTFLLVHRVHDDRVRFIELNALSYTLLEWLRIEPDQTPRAVLENLAERISHPDAEEVVGSGQALLQYLIMRGIIIGTR